MSRSIAWKSAPNRFHPYGRKSRENEINISNESDQNCAGDTKLTKTPSEDEEVRVETMFDSDGQKCPICLDTQSFTEMRRLPCNHSFHDNCISHWLQLKRKCPVCRHSTTRHASQEEELDGDDTQEDVEVLYENDEESDGQTEILEDSDDEEADSLATVRHLCPDCVARRHRRSGSSRRDSGDADYDETDEEDDDDAEWDGVLTEDDEYLSSSHTELEFDENSEDELIHLEGLTEQESGITDFSLETSIESEEQQ